MQQRLLDLGFWLSGVDGDYGATTKQAVMAFQKWSGLERTGKLDQVTADFLNATTPTGPGPGRPAARSSRSTRTARS